MTSTEDSNSASHANAYTAYYKPGSALQIARWVSLITLFTTVLLRTWFWLRRSASRNRVHRRLPKRFDR